MPHKELNYIARLRELGFRVTPQRQVILDTLCEIGSHATANQVYEKVTASVPHVNRATVYRVLDFFCNLRMATKTEIDGETVYEIVGKKPHHHLVCRHCGGVELLANYHFNDLQNLLLEAYGFEAELDHLVIHGICSCCRAGQEGKAEEG